ncbi:GNAT family N-acetyltransferase [Xaviernesmea oryzae]|uniref:GNAT family N-acetyltransferase n=1 Tax=Xaviernesmea oryzae TaxID=464029 RepID=A0A1Q9B389_9HYPH|nr:GNAT family N-acetyltransferase [Xaviernesmea oryzae]OLP62485.1 GNAT family N-acetyltransferase [Xaviernesmea oryzae]SEM17372.1 Acetyltransferase (GNAT) domain-containing protein [Xaviernesmea oryzae]
MGSESVLVDFGAEHLDSAVALSRQVQWPHRHEDWKMALDRAGHVVGTVLMTPYAADVATISMVIVDEAMRGQGLGRRLMERALALAGTRAVRLVATADGLPLYEKLGFRATGTVMQHQGVALGCAAPETVSAAQNNDLDAIVALDRAASRADRSALLAHLGRVGRFAVIKGTSGVEAYAALRSFGRGEVIGPVISKDAERATRLIAAFMADRAGQFLRVDTTAAAGLSDWLIAHGLAKVGGGIAMRRSDEVEPSAPYRIFALASQALG